MRRPVVPAIVVLLLLVATGAVAQEQGQVGIVMGYPASIGLTWQVSPGFAVRPDFSFTRTSTEAASTVSSFSGGYTSTASAPSVGLSALLYLGKWDKATAYITPRFAYARLSNTNTQTANGNSVSSSNNGNAYAIAGSIGAQCALTRRFGAFGEFGFSYNRQKITYPVSETTTTTWGTRTAVGVILYLN